MVLWVHGVWGRITGLALVVNLTYGKVHCYVHAGVTPFVVAGIEFSKIIIAQKRCEVCGGSGLVLREKEKDYLRCPECGMIAFTSPSHIMYSI
ncbi:hypothetical protein AAZX31_16G164200 [Glycine max]